ncbi:MAG: hypothetical protein WC781_04745 [Candidatus Pacearchaeota archaeon]|jgi:hypothetical protein
MEITLTYKDGQVIMSEEGRMEETNKEEYILGGLSPRFRDYVEDLKEVFKNHMNLLENRSENKSPVGKLEISLEMRHRMKQK